MTISRPESQVKFHPLIILTFRFFFKMGHDPTEQVKTPAEDYKYINFLETFNAMALSGKIGVALFGTGRAGKCIFNVSFFFKFNK